MNGRLKSAMVLCAFSWVALSPLYAQTSKSKPKARKTVSEKAKLEQQKKKLMSDISATNKLLKETEKNKEAALQRAGLLNTKIQQRNTLINTYRSQIAFLEGQINQNRKEISELENQLNAMKSSYSRMIFLAYKNRESYDNIMYILAADNINLAYRRFNYFKQASDFRRLKAQKIRYVREGIAKVTHELEQDRIQKARLLEEETGQRQLLESEKKEQEVLIAQLKGKEAELKKRIEKNERERINLEAKIKKIIDAEIAAEKKRAEEKARKDAEKKAAVSKPSTKPGTTAKPVVMNVTPETRALSNSFEGNKGALPWPVEKGAITGNFGAHPHAVLKNISVKNDGIDITAPAGSSARAVFPGTVSGVFPVEGYGNVVIIRHGEYLTVYSNLADVSVSKDQNVKAKDKIGNIEISENGKCVMNFQIRKGSEILNPSVWLAR
jgi:septal ring factor EnvC (AmiA/AmiB activator)